ncbi:MAG: OmpA family protein, partial [Cryomorphaceae bacterium]
HLSSSAVAQRLIGDSLSRRSAHKVMRMAHQSMKFEDWYSAIELLELYAKKRPKRTRAKYELGRLYYQIRQYEKAEYFFSVVTKADSNAFPEAWYYRGQCSKSLGNYTHAQLCFAEFKLTYRGLKDRRKFRRLLKAELTIAPLLDSITNAPLPAEINAIRSINGKSSETGILNADENTLLYTALQKDDLPVIDINDSLAEIPVTKIYKATLDNNRWTKVGLLEGEVNEMEGHVGNPIITHDGRYLIFSVCKDNWQGKTTCELYQSRRVNDKWKRVEKMKDGINVGGGFTTTQPAVGRDPERNRYILYFVSDRPGGKGGKDIWYTRYNKRDDQWDRPRNCGSKINTVGDEETPWVDLSEGTLYFSSNGHPGIGGMDIYKSIGERGRWTEAELLGIPINSSADDVYFRKQPRERYMLLTSNRKGSQSLWEGTCCDDVYEVFFPKDFHSILRLTAFEIPDPDGELNGRATLPETVFKVFFIDPETGDKFFVKSDTSVSGVLDLKIEPGRVYSVEGIHPGYFSDIHKIDTRKMLINDTMQVDLEMKKWDEKPIRVPNIYFEFNRDKLTSESQLALDTSIYHLMVTNPDIIIEIMAHTDNKGTSAYNNKLSQSRAESVVAYLQKKKIEGDRMTAKGYGEAQPIAPNEHADGSDNPEGRAQNRRVEFRVIGTKMKIRSID